MQRSVVLDIVPVIEDKIAAQTRPKAQRDQQAADTAEHEEEVQNGVLMTERSR